MSFCLNTVQLQTNKHPLGQALRYSIVAVAGYGFALASYATLLGVGVDPYAAVSLVFVLNGIFNFVGFRTWAFPPSGRRSHGEFIRFCIVAIGSLGVNYGSFAVLYEAFALPAVLAQALAIAFAAPFGFFANRLWTFREDRREFRYEGKATR